MDTAEVIERVKKFFSGKKGTAVVTALGVVGMLLILISSVIPEGKTTADEIAETSEEAVTNASDYCRETEKRLEDFLKNIEGAGEVKVYISVESDERYVYVSEGRKSVSGDRSEEEEKYVIVGNSGEKSALVETVEKPEITGAVIVCEGCGSAVVQERIYKAVSSALGISSNKIYVTQMK